MNEPVKSLGQNVTKARFQRTLLSTVGTVATIMSEKEKPIDNCSHIILNLC